MKRQARHLCSVGDKGDLRIDVLVEKSRLTLRKNIQIGLTGKLRLQMIAAASHIEKNFRRQLIPAGISIKHSGLQRNGGALFRCFYLSQWVLRLEQMLADIVNAAAGIRQHHHCSLPLLVHANIGVVTAGRAVVPRNFMAETFGDVPAESDSGIRRVGITQRRFLQLKSPRERRVRQPCACGRQT